MAYDHAHNCTPVNVINFVILKHGQQPGNRFLLLDIQPSFDGSLHNKRLMMYHHHCYDDELATATWLYKTCTRDEYDALTFHMHFS